MNPYLSFERYLPLNPSPLGRPFNRLRRAIYLPIHDLMNAYREMGLKQCAYNRARGPMEQFTPAAESRNQEVAADPVWRGYHTALFARSNHHVYFSARDEVVNQVALCPCLSRPTPPGPISNHINDPEGGNRQRPFASAPNPGTGGGTHHPSSFLTGREIDMGHARRRLEVAHARARRVPARPMFHPPQSVPSSGNGTRFHTNQPTHLVPAPPPLQLPLVVQGVAPPQPSNFRYFRYSTRPTAANPSVMVLFVRYWLNPSGILLGPSGPFTDATQNFPQAQNPQFAPPPPPLLATPPPSLVLSQTRVYTSAEGPADVGPTLENSIAPEMDSSNDDESSHPQEATHSHSHAGDSDYADPSRPDDSPQLENTSSPSAFSQEQNENDGLGTSFSSSPVTGPSTSNPLGITSEARAGRKGQGKKRPRTSDIADAETIRLKFLRPGQGRRRAIHQVTSEAALTPRRSQRTNKAKTPKTTGAGRK